MWGGVVVVLISDVVGVVAVVVVVPKVDIPGSIASQTEVDGRMDRGWNSRVGAKPSKRGQPWVKNRMEVEVPNIRSVGGIPETVLQEDPEDWGWRGGWVGLSVIN